MASNVLIGRLIKYLLIWVRSFPLRKSLFLFVFSRLQLLLFSGSDCTFPRFVSRSICACFKIAFGFLVELGSQFFGIFSFIIAELL